MSITTLRKRLEGRFLTRDERECSHAGQSRYVDGMSSQRHSEISDRLQPSRSECQHTLLLVKNNSVREYDSVIATLKSEYKKVSKSVLIANE